MSAFLFSILNYFTSTLLQPPHIFLLKNCVGSPRPVGLRPIEVNYFTSIPMLRAEPATILISPSSSLAFKSTSFFLPISRA